MTLLTRHLPFLVLTVAVALVMSIYNHGGITEMAHESVKIHLRLYAESIYEYHGRTGRWPTRIDDLAQTALPLQSPHWRAALENESNVIVWPKDMKPNLKDNADVVLVYHDKGTIATEGRKWVCWGDLRTEYISTEELQRYLRAEKERRGQ
jgi:hypothetical protein